MSGIRDWSGEAPTTRHFSSVHRSCGSLIFILLIFLFISHGPPSTEKCQKSLLLPFRHLGHKFSPKMSGIKRPINSFKEQVELMSDPDAVILDPPQFTFSAQKPPNVSLNYVTQYACHCDPLVYSTFLSRRERTLTEQGEIPIPIPFLGSKPAAILLDFQLGQKRPRNYYRTGSPVQVRGVTPIFMEDRENFIGRPKASQSYHDIQPLLDSLSGFRTLHLLINFSGVEKGNPRHHLSSGFASDDDLAGDLKVRQPECFYQQISFTSRWQVDLFLSEAAFSVHVLVSGYQWLVVAPLAICQLIQQWSVRNNATRPALIRSHPNLTEAFQELGLALAPDHELIFLSPQKFPETISQLPGFGMRSFRPEELPDDLPSGPSQAFFSPVTMLVASPSFDEHDDSSNQKFNVLYTDFGNSPVKLRRCQGRRALEEFTPQGYTFVIPFHEFDRQYKDTLAFELMQAMPYYCWPSPVLSTRQVLELMEPAFADRPHRVLRPSDDGGQA